MPDRRAWRIDDLDLRSALGDVLLPLLVAAMSFLAALALAGAFGCAALATHWQGDTLGLLTVQVPDPATPAAAGTRLSAVLATLAQQPSVSAVHELSSAEVNALLAPWLGGTAADLALPLPAVIGARWQGGEIAPLASALDKIAPGTLVESGAGWASRITALTTSLQACAAAVLFIVTAVACAIVAVATRAGLAQRRDTIEIIHSLGAFDGDIAERFAARATWRTAVGALLGALIALPVLIWLATLAAPFAGGGDDGPSLPAPMVAMVPILPLIAAAIGWVTAQITVRRWLRRLV
jgi:cell division transport system permease protein